MALRLEVADHSYTKQEKIMNKENIQKVIDALKDAKQSLEEEFLEPEILLNDALVIMYEELNKPETISDGIRVKMWVDKESIHRERHVIFNHPEPNATLILDEGIEL
jgi:hypothetical protein